MNTHTGIISHFKRLQAMISSILIRKFLHLNWLRKHAIYTHLNAKISFF
jgi:hypothetical protein